MAKHPEVGEAAPDFELDGTSGRFRLADHRGEKVMLLFYPGDETKVCTKQFCSYRDNAEAFGSLGVTAVGISGKNVDSKKSFSENHGLNVPLLADPDGEVSRSYGADSNLAKSTKRAVVVIDEEGRIAHRHENVMGLGFQTVADLKQTLESLPAR